MQIFSLGTSPLSFFRNWKTVLLDGGEGIWSHFMIKCVDVHTFHVKKLCILIGILKKVGWPAGTHHCPLSKTEFFLHSLQLQIWPASQPAFDKKKTVQKVLKQLYGAQISSQLICQQPADKCDLETIFFADSLQPQLLRPTSKSSAAKLLLLLLFTVYSSLPFHCPSSKSNFGIYAVENTEFQGTLGHESLVEMQNFQIVATIFPKRALSQFQYLVGAIWWHDWYRYKWPHLQPRVCVQLSNYRKYRISEGTLIVSLWREPKLSLWLKI